MEIKEFTDSLPKCFQLANSMCEQLSGGKVKLSPSLDCLNDLDEIVAMIHDLWKKNLVDDTVAWNASVTFGAILGEAIIREEGFHWALNDEEVPVVGINDSNWLSPITKIYKIITSKEEDEGIPSSFYSGFKAVQSYYAMSDEEKEKITVRIPSE